MSSTPSLSSLGRLPFPLDDWQQSALDAVLLQQDVLVAAHTGSGKSVCLDVAAGLALQRGLRVLYTSPLKALSNQKFGALRASFGSRDIGLITGDGAVQPEAQCLVLTTEILRKMLYESKWKAEDLLCVIFDEAHYLRDPERGVVWEECIMMLPEQVSLVFLSATISNAQEFADWVSGLRPSKPPCKVVVTNTRPVPLKHYVFPSGGKAIFAIVDDQGNFKESNFQKAFLIAQETKGNDVKDCRFLVNWLIGAKFSPVIVFAFRRKDCELFMNQLNEMDFTTEEEKILIRKLWDSAMNTLAEDERKIDEIAGLLNYLERGIAVHHSGLLPIVKEIIELLFQETLIKALFATETFAMGVNMPAKTVVFASATKFDGSKVRSISSGEYIQMSGRAGRRGIDDKGLAIMMVSDRTSMLDIKNIVCGESFPLESAFRISYNMILNCLRPGSKFTAKEFIEKSFLSFQTENQKKYKLNGPTTEEKITKLSSQIEGYVASLSLEEESKVQQYLELEEMLSVTQCSYQQIFAKPKHILPFLVPGRVIKMYQIHKELGYGVVLGLRKRYVSEVFLIDVLVASRSISGANEDGLESVMIIPIELEMVESICSVRMYLPSEMISLDSKVAVWKAFQTLLLRFNGTLPLLDYKTDLEVCDDAMDSICEKLDSLRKRFKECEFSSLSEEDRFRKLTVYQSKKKALNDLQELRKSLKTDGTNGLLLQYKQMMRLLRRLGFIDENDNLTDKGSFASCIEGVDAIVFTELLFSDVMKNLSPNEISALMSCFFAEGKIPDDSVLTVDSKALEKALICLKERAKVVGDTMLECNMSVDVEKFVSGFQTGLASIVKSWMDGSSFPEICSQSSGKIFEGALVRLLRRTHEGLISCSVAFAAMGDPELEEKFITAASGIKRGIPFAGSLYT